MSPSNWQEKEAENEPGPTVRDIAAYVAESGFRLGLGALVGVFVARYLGPKDLGLLAFGVSVFGLLLPFSTLGMRSILVRDFAIEDDWRPFLVASLSRQVPAAFFASIAAGLILVTARSFEPDAIAIAIALLPLPLLGLGDTQRALLEARGKVRRVAIVGILAVVATSALKLAAIAFKYPVWSFALLITIEAAIVAVGLIWRHFRAGVVGSIRHHYSKDVASKLVRESWPLLLAAVAVTLYMKVDITMLGILSGDGQTGIYVAAARLSEVWYFLPVAVAAALRPRLSRLFKTGNTEAYETITQRFLSGSTIVACAVALITLVVARPLVDLVYGPEFAAAAPVLEIHIFAAPFVFLGVASSQWFVDQGMTRAVMIRSSVGATVNVGLNFLLIPWFGPTGAAIATLVSYAIAAMLMNGFVASTRPLFRMQVRAFRVAWS